MTGVPTGSIHRGTRNVKSEASSHGALFMNADDWGRDRATTDRTVECHVRGALSSVSAMMFMADSERAGSIAGEHRIDVGLHLNFTTPYSALHCPTRLKERQGRVAQYLLRHRLAQVLFHPGLAQDFDYVVAAQLDDFERIYGRGPKRLDGHHHMHLCANVLVQGLLPNDTVVRRNFSFEPSEKSIWNRTYRRFVDYGLSRRHHLADFFFSLRPLDAPGRLERIYSLARESSVEVAVHAIEPAEREYLCAGRLFRDLNGTAPKPAYVFAESGAAGGTFQ